MKMKTLGHLLAMTTVAALATTPETQAQNIYRTPNYQWKGNQIIQGKYKARALSATEIVSNYKSE